MNQFIDPSGKAQPTHVNGPFLQAVYLQQCHIKMTGICLPIFEYSRLHGILEQRHYTEDYLLELWGKTCTDFMLGMLEKMELKNLVNLSVEDIKILAVYGSFSNYYDKHNAIYGKATSADLLYPDSLKLKINQCIESKKKELLSLHCERICQELESGKINAFSLEGLRFLEAQPLISETLKNYYLQECQKFLKENFFSDENRYFDEDIGNNNPDQKIFKILETKKFSDLISSGKSQDLKLVNHMLNFKFVAYYYLAKHLGFSEICEKIQSKVAKEWGDRSDLTISNILEMHNSFNLGLEEIIAKLKSLLDEEYISFFDIESINFSLISLGYTNDEHISLVKSLLCNAMYTLINIKNLKKSVIS